MQQRNRARRGLALALALVLMPICMLLMYIFLDKILVAIHESMRERGRSQTFHMAEAGLVIAYDAFQFNNFAGITHELNDGALVPATGSSLLVMPTQTMSFVPDSAGWFAWKWSPGDPAGQAFADTNEKETIKFRIYYPSKGTWRIDCQANTGTWQSTHTREGTLENNAEYALYSAGDLPDLTKADDVTVTGKVHATGDLYLYPRFMTGTSPSVEVLIFGIHFKSDVRWPIVVTAPVGAMTSKQMLHNPPPIECKIFSDQVEAAGKIIRSRNAHGERWDKPGQTVGTTGVVTIVNGTTSAVMAGGAPGVALDSENTSWWKSNSLAYYGNVVRDGNSGARMRDTMDPRTLLPNFYYYRQAAKNGLLIDGSGSIPGVTPGVTFFNNAECRNVTVFDIDVAAMPQPANGLVYATGPIRLLNATTLNYPLTVACPATIYTKGSYNYGNPRQPAALITLDRVYHLSDGWSDADPRNNPHAPKVQTEVEGTDPNPIDPKQFPPHASQATPPGRLVINADIIDGVPTVNELNWVQSYNNVSNPYYRTPHGDGGNYWPSNIYGAGYVSPANYFGFPWQAQVNCAAGGDCFLEEFCQLAMIMDEPSTWLPLVPGNPDAPFPPVTFERNGSLMHLQCATMGNFTLTPPTWEQAPFVTPWLVKSYYTPYQRILSSEPMFQPGAGQRLPVFAPNISTKTLWSMSQ